MSTTTTIGYPISTSESQLSNINPTTSNNLISIDPTTSESQLSNINPTTSESHLSNINPTTSNNLISINTTISSEIIENENEIKPWGLLLLVLNGVLWIFSIILFIYIIYFTKNNNYSYTKISGLFALIYLILLIVCFSLISNYKQNKTKDILLIYGCINTFFCFIYTITWFWCLSEND